MDRLADFIENKTILNLCGQYMKRTCEQGGWFWSPDRGISLGCPLSPLIGAFFLRDLDMRMEKTGLFYVRFMDDILVLAPTHELAEQIALECRKLLGRSLGLNCASLIGGVGKYEQLKALRAGCEVAVGTDPTNCGACGNVCNVANGTSVCRDSACGFGACNAGFASCDGNDANGCETNLQTASAHCGACGNACSGGQICRDSACVMAGGFSTDWVPQMGTNQQFTRCGSVSASGPASSSTCIGPG
jgi:hypothetical protein